MTGDNIQLPEEVLVKKIILDVTFNKKVACICNDNADENINILRKQILNFLQKSK